MRTALATLLLIAAVPAAGAEQWLRLRTGNFEIVTSAGEREGKAMLLHLEEVRSFFLRASPVKNLSAQPLRVVVFGTEPEFRHYAINQVASAYFLPGTARDFIVVDGPATADFGVLTHEYMHLIINHSGMKLPAWLNEGLADLYSTLRPIRNEAAIGDLIPGRVAELDKDLWLDFRTLTSVTTGSPIYNEATRAGMFYAQSWALVHMLFLAPEYAEGFGKMVTALSRGTAVDTAFKDAWGKSGDAVMEDLKAYFSRKKLAGRIYDARLDRENAEPTVEQLTGFDSRVNLAELAAASHRPEEAKAALDALEAEKPGNADVAMTIGTLAFMYGDMPHALEYFEKAYERGETDARMNLTLAQMEQAGSRRGDIALGALERAVKSRPDLTEASIRLGLVHLDRREFPVAISTLMRIPVVEPAWAPDVFCALGYAYIETGDLEHARKHLDTCKLWAKADVQVNRVAFLQKLLEARARPAAQVKPGEPREIATGLAQALDCPQTPGQPAVLRLLDGDKPKAYIVPDPAAIELVNNLGGARFGCGPLNSARMQIEYVPTTGPAGDGIARRVQF